MYTCAYMDIRVCTCRGSGRRGKSQSYPKEEEEAASALRVAVDAVSLGRLRDESMVEVSENCASHVCWGSFLGASPAKLQAIV